MKLTNLFLISCLVLVTGIAKADKTPNGFDVSKCTKCHSESAEDDGDAFPRLNGQTSEYFTAAIKAYKNKTRHTGTAGLMASRVNLDATTVTQLATYFNQKAPSPAIQGGDVALIAKGKDIYENGLPDQNVDSCIMCHAQDGAGNAKNPRLAGQFKHFLANQLHSYAKGEIDGAKYMTDTAKALKDADIDALATYLQSL